MDLMIIVPNMLMNLPKKGTDRAMRRVDTTKADLSMTMFEYFC